MNEDTIKDMFPSMQKKEDNNMNFWGEMTKETQRLRAQYAKRQLDLMPAIPVVIRSNDDGS